MLIRLFEEIGGADEKWLGMFMGSERTPARASAYDRAYQALDTLAKLLEGSLKPHLRLMYGMLRLHKGFGIPIDLEVKDFGQLISEMPQEVPGLHLLLIEPEHDLPFSQWRNVGAHRDFVVLSNRTVEITFGPRANRQTKRVSIASVERLLTWSAIAVGTIRMCHTIIYIEYMADLKAAGLPDPPLRLESRLVGLCHNLAIVGFQCESADHRSGILTLRLYSVLERSVRDAIVHASQILDQLTAAAVDDPSRRKSVTRVAVELLARDNTLLARASVDTAAALAHMTRKIRLKKYLDRMEFSVFCPPDQPAS